MLTIKDQVDRMMHHYEANLDKIQSAPPNEQLIMERTFSTACMVLDELDGVSVTELAIGIFQFCYGAFSDEFSQRYNSQLSLAFTSPDRFVADLHDFYSTLSSEIRRKRKFPQIADFLGATLRLQSEKRGMVDDKVVNAYLDLSMQTMEYLRPDKDALDTYIQGVSTKGEPLAAPCPYPFSDAPNILIRRKLAIGEGDTYLGKNWEETRRLYAKYGIDIRSPQDFARLEQVQRGHCNMAAALLPFINEHTHKIAPSITYDSQYAPLVNLTFRPFDIEGLQDSLVCGRRPLPEDGVCIQFGDPTGEIGELFLMEVLYKARPYVLYRISFAAGDLSGYYDISDGFLYSILKEGPSQVLFQRLTALFTAIYSALVLPPEVLPPLNSIFKQASHPLQIYLPEL